MNTEKPNVIDQAPQAAPKPAASTAWPSDIPTIDSRDLFGSRHELLIRHRQEIYRLRITRADKLILTK